MSALRPFLFDPLVDWVSTPATGGGGGGAKGAVLRHTKAPHTLVCNDVEPADACTSAVSLIIGPGLVFYGFGRP